MMDLTLVLPTVFNPLLLDIAYLLNYQESEVLPKPNLLITM